MLEQRGDTPLQKSGIHRDIRKAFERILIPLEKADKKPTSLKNGYDFYGKIS